MGSVHHYHVHFTDQSSTPVEQDEHFFAGVSQNSSYLPTPLPEPLAEPLPVPIDLDLSPVIPDEPSIPRPRARAVTQDLDDEDRKLIEQLGQKEGVTEETSERQATANPNPTPAPSSNDMKRLRRCSSETFLVLLNTLTAPDKANIEVLEGKSQKRQRRLTMEEHRQSIQNHDIVQHLQSNEADKFSLNLDLELKMHPATWNGVTQTATTFGGASDGADDYTATFHEPADTGKHEDSKLSKSSQSTRGKKKEKEDGIKKMATRPKRPRGPSMDDMEVKKDREIALSLMDERKARRIQANRKSAQRSRIRKLEFIKNLHASVEKLRGELSLLEPQLQTAKAQQSHLLEINEQLKIEIEKRLKNGENKEKNVS